MCCKIFTMKKIVSVLFALFLVLSVYAQSADVITDILESDEATFGQICYLSAVQMDLVEDTASYDEAIKSLFDNSYIPEIADSDALIPAADMAFIYSHLWEIKGGLMFRLTKGAPRYAFRQFQYDGIIDAETDPASFVSGAQALSIYTAASRKYGDFDISEVSMEAE